MNSLSSQFDVDYFSNCRNNMQKTVFFCSTWKSTVTRL